MFENKNKDEYNVYTVKGILAGIFNKPKFEKYLQHIVQIKNKQ